MFGVPYFQSPSIFASDADTGVNAELVYDIESGFPFRIDPNTGFVYTSDININRESEDYHNMTVIARDGGGREGFAVVQITITDVNDNPPILAAIVKVTIPEDFVVGDMITTVSATDADIGVNRVLTYTLTGGEGHFQIGSLTGVITMIQSVLPLEKRDDFEITISVVDGGIPPMSDSGNFDIAVTDVNDNAPVFNIDGFDLSVIESKSVPSLLTYSPPITSSDLDEGVNAEVEYVATPESSLFFNVSTISGLAEIRLASSLDRESLGFHTIKIIAQNVASPQLMSDVLEIAVTVADANDNPPIFAQNMYATNISEFTEADVPLLLVFASDNDIGGNREGAAHAY